MSPVGGDPDQLTELRRDLATQRRSLRSALHDAVDAIAAFERRSTQFVPQLPGHAALADAVESGLRGAGDDIGEVRDALRAADRWVGATAVDLVWGVEGDRQTVLAAPVGAAHEWARFRRWLLVADIDAGTRMGRLELAAGGWLQQQSWSSVVHGTQQDIARLRGRLSPVTRPITEHTGRVGRVRGVLANSRVSAVARIGGRAVAVSGVVTGVVDAVNGHAEGNREAVVTGVLGSVSSLALLSGVPALQAAGAVVQGGLLVYEHREAIATGATALGGAVLGAVRGLF